MASFKRNIYLVLVLQYLITRICFAFWYFAPASDTGIYFQNASDFLEAKKNGQNFYDYHAEVAEYPPLAMIWMSLPVFFTADETPNYDTWNFVYKLRYILFDFIIFSLLSYWFFKPGPLLSVDMFGLVLFVVSGILLFNFLYERLDYWLAGLIFLAIVLLLSKYHWSMSIITIAVAINFKLIPVVLLPLLLLGSLQVRDIFIAGSAAFWRLFKRFIILVFSVLIIFLPFYIWGGPATLDFFKYHSSRGIQLESLYSSVLLLLENFGVPAQITHNYGAYNLDSPASEFLAHISSFIIMVLVLFVAYLFFYKLKKALTKVNSNMVLFNHTQHAAGFMSQSFIRLAIATLLISMCFSKVLSPQYLLWVVPLFALLSYENKYIKISGVFFLLACAFTTPIYPYLYFTDFVHGPVVIKQGSPYWGVSSALASSVLFLRNCLLILSATVLIIFEMKETETAGSTDLISQ